MKVSVIGAGNVGASCAEYIALQRMAAEVVILDINFLVAPYFDSNFLDNISIIMNKK